MYIEQLRVPYHVSQSEHRFALSVVRDIRQRGYSGPIEVVGSRVDGSHISTTTFASECRQELNPEEYVKWLNTLNELARNHNLSAGNIKELARLLPSGAPKPIRFLLDPQNTWLHLDADLDLEIQTRTGGIQDRYDDAPPPKGSGLTIDVFIPENKSYVHLPNIFDY